MLSGLRRKYSKLRDKIVRHDLASIISAQQYIKELQDNCGSEKRLEPAGFKVYSQNEEDGLIAEIFRRIGVTNRRFVEFGSGNGRENNTAWLLRQDWSGLWMDGGPKDGAVVQRHWANEISRRRLIFRNAFITADNIDSLLRQNDMVGEIDLLSIDLDGNDYHVWSAIEAIQPRVVCIEYNAKFPPPVEWVMPRNDSHVWDGSDWCGASLAALEKLGRSKDYALVGTNITGLNAFFVRTALAAGNFAEPFTVENHYHPPRYYLTPAFLAGHPPRL